MRPLYQVGKRIKSIILYLIYYFLSSIFVTAVFAWIYSIRGIGNPIEVSFEVFWGLDSHWNSNIIKWIYVEKIVNNLFSIILVGSVLTRFLEPINPILFGKYVVYDTVDKKFSFRYWIMLPKGQYLYDVKIKLLLTEYETHQRGINKLNSSWEMNSDNLQLDLARGIGFLELTVNESSDLIKAINKMCYKYAASNGRSFGGEFGVDLSIRGNSENGTTYHGWCRYKKEDILLGYRHVPMQRHSYDTEDFYREQYFSEEERKSIRASEDFYRAGKKEFFRYQHFDKVYRLANSARAKKAEEQRDILTKKQIIHGQHSIPYQLILDFISFIAWFILDSDRKISWVIHKMGEYILHITHIRRF